MFDEIIVACQEASDYVDNDELKERLRGAASVLSGTQNLIKDAVEAKLIATRQVVVLSEIIQRLAGSCSCGRNNSCDFCEAQEAIEAISAGEIFSFWEEKVRVASVNSQEIFEKSYKNIIESSKISIYDDDYSEKGGLDEW